MSVIISFAISPLKLVRDCCKIIMTGARAGVGVNVFSMGMAGDILENCEPPQLSDGIKQDLRSIINETEKELGGPVSSELC